MISDTDIIALVMVLFLLLVFTAAVLWMLFSISYKDDNDEELILPEGCYKLSWFEQWLLLKCDFNSKIVCLLCKLTALIWWSYIVFAVILSLKYFLSE